MKREIALSSSSGKETRVVELIRLNMIPCLLFDPATCSDGAKSVVDCTIDLSALGGDLFS